ncbi:hypothetical protein ABZ371_16265 [Streptomyces sp. NPDC005899]|uniref:hypothetical protein n=1 Tax=Streptomyces sp. NPDC005899 TaxID=3155716 RepID=UPI00340DB9F2
MLTARTAASGPFPLAAPLSWLGDRIEAGRVPLLNRRRCGTRRSGGLAGRVLRPVPAAPRRFAVASVAVLFAPAAPAPGMRTEQLGQEQQFESGSRPSVAYRHISESFSGGPAPALVVIRVDDIDAPEVLHTALGRFDHVSVHRSRDVAASEVPLPGR